MIKEDLQMMVGRDHSAQILGMVNNSGINASLNSDDAA